MRSFSLDEARVMNDAVAADKRRSQELHSAPLHGLPVSDKRQHRYCDAPTIRRDTGTPDASAEGQRARSTIFVSSPRERFASQDQYGTSLPTVLRANNAAFGPVSPIHTMICSSLVGAARGTRTAIAAECAPRAWARHGWIGANTSCSVWHCRAASTVGRYSREGIVPFAYSRYCRPLARSIQDLVLFDSVDHSGPKPIMAKTCAVFEIGAFPGILLRQSRRRACALSSESALAKLRDSGCVVVEADVPDVEKLAAAANAQFVLRSRLADLSQYLKASGANLRVRMWCADRESDVKAIYEDFIVGPKAPTLEGLPKRPWERQARVAGRVS